MCGLADQIDPHFAFCADPPYFCEPLEVSLLEIHVTGLAPMQNFYKDVSSLRANRQPTCQKIWRSPI
jgi:hypothetical protein